MSSVRKCDLSKSADCYGIFSELEEDWQTFTATNVRRGRDGRRETVTEQLDACPACALGEVKPRQLAIEASAEEQREARIRRLEAGLAESDRQMREAIDSAARVTADRERAAAAAEPKPAV